MASHATKPCKVGSPDGYDELRRQLRQERSLPVVTDLCHWLMEQERQVLPRSLIGQAIAYALRHWQALTRYLNFGWMAPRADC